MLIGKIEHVSKGYIKVTPSHSIGRYDGLQIDVSGMEKPFGFSVQNMKQGGKNIFLANAGELTEIALPHKYPLLKAGMNVYLASSTEVKGSYNYQKPKPEAYKDLHM